MNIVPFLTGRGKRAIYKVTPQKLRNVSSRYNQYVDSRKIWQPKETKTIGEMVNSVGSIFSKVRNKIRPKVPGNKTFSTRTPVQKLKVKARWKLRNLNITNAGTAGRIAKKSIDGLGSSIFTAVAPGGIVLGPTVVRPAEKKLQRALKIDGVMSKAGESAERNVTRFVRRTKEGFHNLRDRITPYIQSPTGGQVAVAYC